MPFPLLIPSFFFSAWLLMIFWGMIAPDVGVATAGYPKAMLATIGLWLVVFPLARREGGPKRLKSRGFPFRGGVSDDVKKEFRKAASDRVNSESKELSDDEVDITSSFSGISRKVLSQNFRGGNVNTNFGGVQLDLRDAALAGGEARIEVRAFIGGVEFLVPGDWDVQVDMSTTIGGVSDERDEKGDKDAPKLVITGSATLGGISIKN